MTDSTNREGPSRPSRPEAPKALPESLHQEIIRSHARRPRNRREVEHATATIRMDNPGCGDEIALSLRMEDDRIAEVGFTGEGCSISQSSASMMTILLEGRTLVEAEELFATFRELVHGRTTPEESRRLGDLRALAGVAKFPVRVRCAMLAWNALAGAVRAARSGVRNG